MTAFNVGTASEAELRAEFNRQLAWAREHGMDWSPEFISWAVGQAWMDGNRARADWSAECPYCRTRWSGPWGHEHARRHEFTNHLETCSANPLVLAVEAMRRERDDARHRLDAYRTAVRASLLEEVRARVWPDGHLGSCPRSGEDEAEWWCDCGYSKFLAAFREGTDG